MIQSEFTTFTIDNMGRFLCNTLQEALDSTTVPVGGKPRGFDVIVIGGGTFGSVMAHKLFANENGQAGGFIGLQSYANSPVAFRHIRVKV